eukprot:GILI01013409.1.p1 GENE.GILI01013409.1~~GILI01013409.1.p1  ORF type:complete len:357 (+),score=74.97 GILI01013409.1:59-1129(+)
MSNPTSHPTSRPTTPHTELAELPKSPAQAAIRTQSAPRDLATIYSTRPTALNIDPEQSTPSVPAPGRTEFSSPQKANHTPTTTTASIYGDEDEAAMMQRRMHLELLRKRMGTEFDFLTVPDWVRLHPLLGAYLAEATGTFVYCLTIGLVSVNNPELKGHPETNITPIPVGFMLMCMVFTFGYISGGHFNPAISLSVALAGKMHWARALTYMMSQTGAAFGAGIVSMIIQGSEDIVVPTVKEAGGYREGLFAELIYTFALATVVLNVAYSKQKENFFYGFAIGMTVVAGVSAVGGVSGGAFNPAIATGLQAAVCLVGKCDPLLHFWVYWVSPMLGAVLATILFKQLWQPEDEPEASV